MSEQSHRSDPRILNRRTLYRDHAGLVPFLRPGLAVLDVGCGTGAIATGIAAAVAPGGRVVGVDRDAVLLETARRDHSHVRNLRFEVADARALPFDSEFDIVTAARTVQWIGSPRDAVRQMRNATKPGGRVVILDYNHAANSWEPDPPEEFREFYGAFLSWRETNGWNNHLADLLPDFLREAGLTDIESAVQDEVAEAGTPAFMDAAVIWAHASDALGQQLVASGLLSDERLTEAQRAYRAFIKDGLRRQVLCMRLISGVRPHGS
jgi:SAM-dependent methyltransferase